MSRPNCNDIHGTNANETGCNSNIANPYDFVYNDRKSTHDVSKSSLNINSEADSYQQSPHFFTPAPSNANPFNDIQDNDEHLISLKLLSNRLDNYFVNQFRCNDACSTTNNNRNVST